MTEQEEPGGGRALVQRLAFPIRRAVAPAALELAGQVHALTQEIDALRSRAEAAEARLATLEHRSGELDEGLMEARRLNARVADLTDVVTELVLPLHDREVDAAVLRSLRPEPR